MFFFLVKVFYYFNFILVLSIIQFIYGGLLIVNFSLYLVCLFCIKYDVFSFSESRREVSYRI